MLGVPPKDVPVPLGLQISGRGAVGPLHANVGSDRDLQLLSLMRIRLIVL